MCALFLWKNACRSVVKRMQERRPMQHAAKADAGSCVSRCSVLRFRVL